MVTMDFMARSCLCDAFRDLFIAQYKENTNNPTMSIADQDGSLGIDPLVSNLMYDQISLNPLYLNLAEHHQDRIMDKVVKALSGPTMIPCMTEVQRNTIDISDPTNANSLLVYNTTETTDGTAGTQFSAAGVPESKAFANYPSVVGTVYAYNAALELNALAWAIKKQL